MTIWDWIQDFEEDARRRGDLERLRMARVHNEAYTHRQTDPDKMLTILDGGRRLAERLCEPWWVAFFDHWKLETFIYYKDDYREVIDLAVRLTLELRKPSFDGFPLRFGVWCNLVAAYLCVDPIGYRKPVQEAMDYLQTQVTGEGGDKYLLQARRHWFAYEVGELDAAHRLALEELAMADDDADRHTALHHEVDTYKALCWIAYRRKDWAGLNHYSTNGEERARVAGYSYELALFLLWRGVGSRRDGREIEAAKQIGEGKRRMSRLGQPPGESFYDALAEYHSLGGDLDAAWAVREDELTTTLGKGQLAYECQVRIKRVRLLRKLGRDAADEERRTREAAGRLREPGHYLAELARDLLG